MCFCMLLDTSTASYLNHTQIISKSFSKYIQNTQRVVSEAPTYARQRCDSRRTIHRWPSGQDIGAKRQLFPDLRLFMLNRMQIPLPSGNFLSHEFSHFRPLLSPLGCFGESLGLSGLGFLGSGFGRSGLLLGGSCFGCWTGLGRGVNEV